MRSETLSDTGYYLDINSILFAVLVDHINEDKVYISLDEIENKRLEFWNCGKPCRFSFPIKMFNYKISILNNPYIKNGNNGIVVDLKELFDGFINKLTDEELKFTRYNKELAKIFHLFCYLGVDIRIFDLPYHVITSLLRCNFMYDEIDLSHEEYLFKLAKEINPQASNEELLDNLKTLNNKILKKVK
jgi:hypothetical protein